MEPSHTAKANGLAHWSMFWTLPIQIITLSPTIFGLTFSAAFHGIIGNGQMIGDSATTDVSGAEAVGIPAVLVRSAGGKARRECFSLLELREQMNVGAESWNIEPWSR
jgi:hypothetical protein